MKHAVVIGNGVSRKGIKLDRITAPTFGCNRIVDEFFPTYVVAIDPPMIDFLRSSAYPQHRILTPPESLRYEPSQLHNGATVRSNAGCNAILEALFRGFNHISVIGFDFLLKDDTKKVDNVYAGKDGYFTITPEEATRRNPFFGFIVQNSPDILFNIVFPRDVLDQTHKVNAPNAFFVATEDFVQKAYK